MKKYLDKLSKLFNLNKTSIIFLFSLFIVGIICGSIFNIIINKNDQNIVSNYLSDFFLLINENKMSFLECFKDSILFNYGYALIIWALGISVIGLPILIFMFFGKSFSLGFTLSAIIKNYGVKGCLLVFGYVFPHCIINILLFLVLTLYATTLSIKLIKCIIKRKSIDFKPIMKKYIFILIVSLIVILLTSLYEAFLMPVVLEYILNLIKI